MTTRGGHMIDQQSRSARLTAARELIGACRWTTAVD
jgi:hypothetical protein